MPKRSREKPVTVQEREEEASLSAGWLPALAAAHGVRVFLPRGEVSGEGYALIERAVRPPLRPGAPRIVLDLSRVDHLDYRGLPALGRAAARLRAEGGDLRLAGASSYLKAILRFGGLDSVLLCFPGVSEAVSSFAPRRTSAAADR
ncbi:MAG TPA: STAS domain-containing protein [Myxococcales bacterium]|nr:STAS domain-containing protein [Myxococcales bacterium]